MREYGHPASTWILLADVRMSQRRRQGLSARKVELYRQWLEDGRHAPPVRLARDGGGFVVRDGRHRVAAALAAGHVDIEAVLRRLLGMKLWWRSTSLATRRSGFDSRRLHSNGAAA
jgi:ParB-like chromosome segregation protein Spo0J